MFYTYKYTSILYRNILRIKSMLKMFCSSTEYWDKASNFPYIDQMYSHGGISVHQPTKPGVLLADKKRELSGKNKHR